MSLRSNGLAENIRDLISPVTTDASEREACAREVVRALHEIDRIASAAVPAAGAAVGGLTNVVAGISEVVTGMGLIMAGVSVSQSNAALSGQSVSLVCAASSPGIVAAVTSDD